MLQIGREIQTRRNSLETKSRNRSLKEGERNTKLFQRSVNQNRMQNKIIYIKNTKGERVETREEIENTLNIYFTDILTESSQDKRGYIEKITRFIPSLVTHEKNTLPMKPITLIEVEEAEF